jgi:hypothetical protein
MTEWRKFTDQMEYSGEPSAKLYKNGIIRFNKVAGQLWFSGVEHVEIYVSDDTDELAFKPAPTTREGTYSYSRDGEHGGNVSVRSVLPHYGIWHERVDESVALPVRHDDEEHEMVVVDLSEPVERWGRPSIGGGGD